MGNDVCPIITIGRIQVAVFPIILLLAIYACLFVLVLSSRYTAQAYVDVKKSIVPIMIGATLGGKTLYALTRIADGEQALWGILNGFVFYGGILGATIGLWIYTKKHKIPFFVLSDIYASLLPLGQAIGRLGCFLNGCCYGKPYDGIGGVVYPVNGTYIRVFPTWFVEAGFCFLLFIYMFKVCESKAHGFYTAVYITGYSVFRFVIEFFRGDEVRGGWHGISTSQMISVPLMFCGIVMFHFIYANSVRKSS